RQSRAAAQQQGDPGRLSARLDLQDLHRPGGARIQGDRSRHRAAVPRLPDPGRHQVPLLAVGRPWRPERAGRDHQLVRLLLLRGRPPRRRRQDRRGRRQAGLRQGERARPAGRIGRQPAVARLEAGQIQRALAAGRQLQPRHRPGLHDGDALAARDHDRARGQRRLRGAAEPPARQGDAARGAGAAADPREARRTVAALEPAVREHRPPGHDRRGECRRRHGQPAPDRRQGQADRAAVPLRRQDRHGAGQAHHRARTPDGHHPGLAALAPAPPRAVRLLRADRQSALCLRGDRRARHGGRRDRRPDRPRRAARDHEARSLAPHRPLQEDGGAMTLSSLGLSTPAPVSFGEKIWRINWGLILVLTAIAAVGVVALYSAAGGRFDPWAGKHAMRYGVALGLCLVVALINPKVWLALAWPIYIVSMLLLVAVDVIGKIGMGAQRWLVLGPMQIQPSEIAKVAVILVLARYYHGLTRERAEQFLYTLPPLMIIMAPVALVMVQPDLGTAMMVLLGGAALLFVAGVRIWMFLGAAVAAVGC